jgi:DNA-binding winged helix-turn-helix (wHTH) protein
MGNPVPSPRVYRFESFTLDARTGELSRDGSKTPLREQPLHLLLALLEQPGELVTREELVSRLWPGNTFVDFDRGLNKAVNHLREALGDSAEQPQFVETLPRKGYRFIAAVTHDGKQREETAPAGARALVEAARCYAQIGQKDEALALLEQCFERRCSSMVTLKAEPDFEVLQHEARFQNLLLRIGLL